MKRFIFYLLALRTIVSASIGYDSVFDVQPSYSHRYIPTGKDAMESNARVAFEPIPKVSTFDGPSMKPPESYGNVSKVESTLAINHY